MANVRKWIKAAESKLGEQVEAIVIGAHVSDYRPPSAKENRVLSRDEGLKVLDREFDDGFGTAGCPPMFAWTRNWILTISEYDGATSLSRIPRNPVDCAPFFDGVFD